MREMLALILFIVVIWALSEPESAAAWAAKMVKAFNTEMTP